MHVHRARLSGLSDAEALAEVRRRLEARALQRRGLRKALRLSGWLALAPTGAVAAWVGIGDGPAAALLALCGFFPVFCAAAWIGLAVFYWIAEAAEGARDLLCGED